MKISPARISAFEILLKIEKEKAFSSVLLPIYEENLSLKDSALCHELTLGVLRRKFYLDRIIKKLTKKNLKKFDVEVLTALRLGLYQIVFLDKIPAYSSINDSVNLVKKAKKVSAKGLVNAVLRRASREKTFNFEFADEIERISVETSHPRWLIEYWKEQFGFEEMAKIAVANNETPPTAFRPTGKFYGKDADYRKKIFNELETLDFGKSEIIEDCFISDRSSEYLRELAAQGLIYFQDHGSQIISNVVDLKANESFIDICASPGSKATFIAGQKVKDNGQNLLVAGDFYSHRIRTLKNNCANQMVEFINIVQYDALEELPFSEESFDVVLIDAPCTGTGTIRHNPEIRYFLEREDFAELSGKQLKILQNASKLVKSDGRIIYSTCSLETQENEEVIGKFQKTGEFKLDKLKLPERFLTSEGFGRTFPHRDNMDGFFIAAFKKM